MAYQNVGTPRFYVDKLSYVKALGKGDGNTVFDFNPSNQLTRPAGALQAFHFNMTDSFPLGKLNFYALLGHSFAGKKGQVQHQDGDDNYTYWSAELENHFAYGTTYPNINIEASGNFPLSEHDGFSIGGLNIIDDYPLTKKIMWYYQAAEQIATDATLGAFLVGEYYDIPHSPDLNLTMSIEMDGVKNIKTKGGASLTGVNYTKPQDWGSMGAWQLDGAANLRSGRRVWDLSFNYLSDTDIMPENAGTFPIDDIETNILDGTDFFSVVWNKTMGGHLPFIFQPDGSNNNPDQFAICRFDMGSLQYDQVANNVYNVKLKIRECW